MTRAAALHRAYRAVLVALGYPGRRVPVAPTTEAALALVLGSTWDAGCRVALAGVPPPLPWASAAAPAAGAELLVVGGGGSGGALARLPRGDEACPEAGATAVYAVAEPGPGRRLRLRGPGVAGHLDTELPLDASELDARDAACATWPLGVDLLVIDSAGRVAALPRTTRVERLR
ncbi:MAG TPA: phosphonate C-P lyase system protein PhnH [Candidatus Dormibacteraeota bacterium]